ncbi:DUF4328 domain-containing protein [Streptomyces sp. NBC_01341]|uniref:DUF4328 domain-containing protein n=1 Tax=Streptomyces sp. NBC_01341 TaxID=2903831 RepID=UPI002E11C9D8|nr:DUF4328 domain-containing protein [Streptomyces sp. NBC_01341]
MLCTNCGTRPAASVEGRCSVCATAGPLPAPAAPGPHGLRSPVALAKAAVALLGAVIATDVLALTTELNLRGEFTSIGDGAVYDAGSADRAESLYGMAAGLQVIAFLATAVVFVIWFRRVRLNAEVFDASRQPMRPGWAIGAWFVPVANMWLPWRVAEGIWTASAQSITDGTWRKVSKAPLNAWWTLYLVSTFFAQIASRNYDATESSPGLVDAVTLIMAADALDIAAAVMAIAFVRKLTRMQSERAARGTYPLSAPAPGGVPHP